jgi:hypothetical protein
MFAHARNKTNLSLYHYDSLAVVQCTAELHCSTTVSVQMRTGLGLSEFGRDSSAAFTFTNTQGCMLLLNHPSAVTPSPAYQSIVIRPQSPGYFSRLGQSCTKYGSPRSAFVAQTLIPHSNVSLNAQRADGFVKQRLVHGTRCTRTGRR